MKFVFISPESVKKKGIQLLLDHYTTMLEKFGSVKYVWTGREKMKVRSEADIRNIVNAESKRIIKAMESVSPCVKVVFDERGRMFSSVEFAKMLEKLIATRGACLTAAIGGAYGLSDEVRKCADVVVSFSPMTFPHELALVMAVEQIYRAMTILRGEKYHH